MAQTSPFAEGYWVKIAVKESGVYKLPFDSLRAWGFDNPECVAVYGNGAEMPQSVNCYLPVHHSECHLEEIKISLTFQNGRDSAYFFYGEAARCYNFKFQEYVYNQWDRTNYYFISNKKRGKVLPLVAHNYEQTDTVCRHTFFFQDQPIDTFIETEGGAQLYGKFFNNSIEYHADITGEKINPIETFELNIRYYNPYNIKNARISILSSTIDTSFQIEAYDNNRDGLFAVRHVFYDSDPNVTIRLKTINSSDAIVLSSIKLLYNELITYENKPLSINFQHLKFADSDWKNKDASHVKISMLQTNVRVWDVTDKYNVVEHAVSQRKDGSFFFTDDINEKRFYCFKNDDAKSPRFVGPVKNNDILSIAVPNYLIVAHADFMEEAERLADFRRNFNAISVKVINVEDIYNNFTSGKKNPTAIRLYVQHLHERGNGSSLQSLLLIGHGVSGALLPSREKFNKIPVYGISHFAEAFYSSIVDHSLYYYKFDIALGRIPAISRQDVQIVIDKIIDYETNNRLWNNNLTFIAGIEDTSLVTEKMIVITDSFAEKTIKKIPELNINKIYFDAFKDPSNIEDSLSFLLNEGQRVVSNFGHSGKMGWQYGMNITMAQQLKNRHAPIIISHSCNFAKFDEKERCISEELLFNPTGGAVAVVSGVRRVSGTMPHQREAHFNYAITLMDSLLTLGELFTQFEIRNNRVLLGDPYLSFKKEQYNMTANLVRNLSETSQQSLCGAVVDTTGHNGKLYLRFLKKTQVQNFFDAYTIPHTVVHHNKLLFQDSTVIENGKYSYQLPKLSHLENGDSVKVLLYAVLNEQKSASAYTYLPSSTFSALRSQSCGKTTVSYCQNELKINTNQHIKDVKLFTMLGVEINLLTPLHDNSIQTHHYQGGIYILLVRYENSTTEAMKIIIPQ